jgi:hypothetical protein
MLFPLGGLPATFLQVRGKMATGRAEKSARSSIDKVMDFESAAAGQGVAEEKIPAHYSNTLMKITVNMNVLTQPQVKFLSQLGEFRDDGMWEGECAEDDLGEVVAWLKRGMIDDLCVHFG